MTKRQYAVATIVLTIALSVFFWFYLPMEIMGGYRVGNFFMRTFYAVLVAMPVVVGLAFIHICITKTAYIKNQLDTITHFRHLLFLMVKRDFVTRYRRNILGVLWSLLNPLLTMLILTMVFSQIFRFEIPYVNFSVYLLSGQVILGFFSESTNMALSSIVSGAGTIKKVYVPKYIFPVSRVLSGMVNLFFAFIAFLFVVLVTGSNFYWTIFLVPIPILYLLVFSMGVAMFLSAAAVFFRDLAYLYGVFLSLLTFLTPIFYPVSILPTRVFHLIHLNPMFHYVEYFRALAIYGTIPGLWANIVCIGFALVALCVGIYAKVAHQDKYILYL